MRVTLAENRDKPEDPGLEAIAQTIRGNHAFGRQFGSAIQSSLHRKWGRLRSRKDLRLSVHRAGGSEDDLLHPGGPHGFENVGSGDRILLEVLAGMLRSAAHVGVREIGR